MLEALSPFGGKTMGCFTYPLPAEMQLETERVEKFAMQVQRAVFITGAKESKIRRVSVTTLRVELNLLRCQYVAAESGVAEGVPPTAQANCVSTSAKAPPPKQLLLPVAAAGCHNTPTTSAAAVYCQ